MNKSFALILVLLSLGFYSCQKVESLIPIDYPGLLANSIGHVSILDDGTLLVIGNEGMYLRYPDNTTKVINVKSSGVALSTAYGMKFFVGDNVIYGVNGNYVLEIARNTYEFYQSKYDTNGQLTYPGYTMTPDKELLKLSYGNSRYNQDLNRYEWPIRLLEWKHSGWVYYDSDIYVPDIYWSTTPILVFESENRAYILIDKLYEIDYSDYDNIEFEEIIPINGSISDNSMFEVSMNKKEIIGFDRQVHEFTGSNPNTFGRSISFNTTTGKLGSISPTASCGVGTFESFAFDQYIGRRESIAYFYKESVYNSFSTENKRGELYSFDMNDGLCNVSVILAVGPLKGLDINIIDVDFDEQKVILYLGTNRGLYIYDLQNHSIENYLDNLTNEN
tara:strand:+ start:1491 stop:2660 length:1170 start_codon:yes stop_codon:yes gene_type:complete